MIKTLRRDYRREAQEIIKNLKLTDSQIALQLQVSEFSIRRWRRGMNSPQPFQFERLKKLAAGELTNTAGEETPMMMAEILKGIG